jgi:putative transposase
MEKAANIRSPLIEGASENAAMVQALIANLIERGLDPKLCRLFIIDGAKALSNVIRRTFGAHTLIQRCQLHKARNVIERLPQPLHAPVRRALRKLGSATMPINRAAVAQSRSPAYPRKARRDAERHPPRLACKGSGFARLHQLD